MKKVAFIGGYDKTDLILYIGKILHVLRKKILFIDTTLITKTQYIVPTMTPTKKYVTTFDGVDIAIGFENIQELKDYMGGNAQLDYDYLFIDIDSFDAYKNFELSVDDLHFFLTTFDVYSVQKGIKVLKEIQMPIPVTKVLFTKNPESEESEYLDFVTFSYKIKWKDDVVYFPFETDDLYAIFENQRFSKVRFIGLSAEYIESMIVMTEKVANISKNEIKKAIKIIERG